MPERYKVHFDELLKDKTKEDWDKQSKRDLEQFMKEYKIAEQKWLETSSVVDGIPGRCVVVQRDEKGELVVNSFVNQKLIEGWKKDSESVLYYYNDIESAGYILVKSDGTKLTQVAIRS